MWENNRHNSGLMLQPNQIKELCRDIEGFPKEGITFHDVTPILKNSTSFRSSLDNIIDRFKDASIDVVVGIESRGFIFGAPIAYALDAGFVPVRKAGKLPWKTHRVDYALEYGMDSLEIHQDAISRDDRVIIVDDLLATGGTLKAAVELVKRLDGDVVSIVSLFELTDLKGREKLDGIEVYSLIQY